MQPRFENQLYSQLVTKIQEINAKHEIVFSIYSEQLLLLSIISWFNDPILFKKNISLNTEQLSDLAVQVYERAMDQPHILLEKELHHRVSFGALFVSLSDAGKEVLKTWLKKGFR